MFGNSVGRGPYYMVGATRHHANDFANVIGDTSDARKGTSREEIEAVFRLAAGTFTAWLPRITSGLSSGEGLINLVRDADEEEPDRRLMVIEPELSSLLTVMQRHGNNISDHVRNAWDGRPLGTQTKTPLTASKAHISIIGQVTVGDLKAKLATREIANGFINRFLFVLAYRAWILPFPGAPDQVMMKNLTQRLKRAHKKALGDQQMLMSDDAEDLWERTYPKLGRSKGLYGDATNRAATHVIRLSMIYALLDGQRVIELPHLEAARAVVDYSERSARVIIGDLLGNPEADTILRELHRRDLSRTEISNLFNNNRPKHVIDNALELLEENELASCREDTKTGGRKRTVWCAE